MKKTRKALLLGVCAVLLVTASVLGTMAYLTSTDTVTNTFTVGNVTITLDEAKVDEKGNEIMGEGAARVKANTYKLIPGQEYTKDPTVHVAADSENSYVFVKVENGIADIEGGTKIADQITTNGWTALTGNDGVYYKEYTSKNTNEDLVVFEKFTIPNTATSETLDTYKNAQVKITAYAIQKDGFANAKEAWDASGFNA